MSATLAWASSGNGAKTGTAIANFIDDLDTLITSKSGDASFSWQTAGKNNAGTPYWIVLSRKGGAAGRILIVCWTSAPAANNAAILDTAPTTNQIYIAWFPAGTANTASNLTAASGTILGNDSGCVKVASGPTVAAGYGANVVPFYFDSTEGFVLGLANPAVTTCFMLGAGDLLIDASDVVYGTSFATAALSVSSWGSAAGAPFLWTQTATPAGGVAATINTNYGAANRRYYVAWQPSGVWAAQAVGVNDILTNNALNQTWFVPVQLLGQVKGEGFVLKLRQIAYGPGTTGAFNGYNTTGPVVAARQFCNATAGNNVGAPWFVNFKI